jgi:hypothetical protein
VVPVRRRRGDRELGLQVTFGGTSATFDHSVNQSIWISKTLSRRGVVDDAVGRPLRDELKDQRLG